MALTLYRKVTKGHHPKCCVKPRRCKEVKQRGYYRHRLFLFVSRKEKAMPVAKHKPTTLSPEGSTSESSSPVVPDQEEFRQHLRRLAVSAVQVLIEQVMREELDESHRSLVGRMHAHAPWLPQWVLHPRS